MCSRTLTFFASYLCCGSSLEMQGVSMPSSILLMLKAAGSRGVTTVDVSRLMGFDTKRSGKILVVG